MGLTSTKIVGGVNISGSEANLLPNGAEPQKTVTVDNTGGGVTIPALHAGTTHVMVSVDGADVRATFDGVTAPTAAIGIFIANGSRFIWSRSLAESAKFIRAAAANATLSVAQLKGS